MSDDDDRGVLVTNNDMFQTFEEEDRDDGGMCDMSYKRLVKGSIYGHFGVFHGRDRRELQFVNLLNCTVLERVRVRDDYVFNKMVTASASPDGSFAVACFELLPRSIGVNLKMYETAKDYKREFNFEIDCYRSFVDRHDIIRIMFSENNATVLIMTHISNYITILDTTRMEIAKVRRQLFPAEMISSVSITVKNNGSSFAWAKYVADDDLRVFIADKSDDGEWKIRTLREQGNVFKIEYQEDDALIFYEKNGHFHSIEPEKHSYYRPPMSAQFMEKRTRRNDDKRPCQRIELEYMQPISRFYYRVKQRDVDKKRGSWVHPYATN